MAEGRDGYGAFARRLVVIMLVLAPLGAGAAEPDPRLAQNPVLGQIAATDPAEAGRLLDAIDRMLQHADEPASRGITDGRTPRMRGSFYLDAADEALLADNPLLGQAFAHDPVAAVELLKRVKGAGGRRQ